METLTIKTDALRFTDEEFFNFCSQNRDLRIERDKNQTIYVMAPLGFMSGNQESSLNFYVQLWNNRSKLGYVFSSSTGFTLKNNAVRSPDVAWVKKERYESMPVSERKKFGHLCPDFIIELRSESDSLKQLKEKMVEWIDNGCCLAWLIDPIDKKTYIYKPNEETEILNGFNRKISGENVLSGFVLDLRKI